MKKSLAVLWTMLLLVGLLVTGCKSTNGPEDDNAPAGVTNEQSARAYFATNDDFTKVTEEAIDDEDLQGTDYTLGKIDTAMTPLRWGRFIRSVERVVTDTVRAGDSIAVVHVVRRIHGVLRVLASINGRIDTVNKPFVDETERNIVFKRVGRETRRFWLNWVPVASSLVEGGTVRPNSSINLTQLEFITPNDTITIIDPLHFFFRYRWLRLFNQGNKDIPEINAGTLVTIRATLVSESPDTDLVALRFGADPLHKRRMRMRFVSQTQRGSDYIRVFERDFTMHFHRGFFHAAVDAMSKATLFDNQSPYSVSWWGVPYRVN